MYYRYVNILTKIDLWNILIVNKQISNSSLFSSFFFVQPATKKFSKIQKYILFKELVQKILIKNISFKSVYGMMLKMKWLVGAGYLQPHKCSGNLKAKVTVEQLVRANCL